jgi:hypothetical protein
MLAAVFDFSEVGNGGKAAIATNAEPAAAVF